MARSKLAPDLSIHRLRERLATQEVADRPEHVEDPDMPWWRVEHALNTASAILSSHDDAAAQGHLDAFGDTLHTIARATPGRHRHELVAAARAFNRARRSTIRADHQAATALRQAAKELAYASSAPGGLTIAVLFAALHLARAAANNRYEQDLHAALPAHADRVLADPAWSALTTTLARAETAGHNPRRLLATVGTQRELDSAERPAEVLNWRITAQPNKRAQAARRRSTISGASSVSATLHPPATPVAMRPEERGRHR